MFSYSLTATTLTVISDEGTSIVGRHDPRHAYAFKRIERGHDPETAIRDAMRLRILGCTLGKDGPTSYQTPTSTAAVQLLEPGSILRFGDYRACLREGQAYQDFLRQSDGCLFNVFQAAIVSYSALPEHCPNSERKQKPDGAIVAGRAILDTLAACHVCIRGLDGVLGICTVKTFAAGAAAATGGSRVADAVNLVWVDGGNQHA